MQNKIKLIDFISIFNQFKTIVHSNYVQFPQSGPFLYVCGTGVIKTFLLLAELSRILGPMFVSISLGAIDLVLSNTLNGGL